MTDGRQDWDAIDRFKYRDEGEAARGLLEMKPYPADEAVRISLDAADLVRRARAVPRNEGVVQSFLHEFSLGTREGIALMCLAEALLRVPDTATRDHLIAEKIAAADWASHLGHSGSLFVNASTWGLMLTGRLLDADEQAKHDIGGFLTRLAGRIGEPVIRQAVAAAVRMMGEQFVLGRTIESALARAGREGLLCSFDMLGEGARTAEDGARYEHLYADAIEHVGRASAGRGPEAGHGISVKLSALSPRYDALHEPRLWQELYPRLQRLALLAAGRDLSLAIDAEEVDRLVPSLKMVERLARDPALDGWTGLGVVVQAYQKRGLAVIGGLERLARESGRRIMVRLVKGAYWDSEIKRAQVAGHPDYPVFTTKAATDLSYLVCARALIAASPALYPQFATHNAHTLAAVRALADRVGATIEHQRLHGMGEALYRAAEDRYGPLRLRAYAPVGGHEELLPYLVRRLLENGANTSFVHSLLDSGISPEAIVADPVAAVEAHPVHHPKIPPPPDIYGPERRNAPGRDLTIATVRGHILSLPFVPVEAGGDTGSAGRLLTSPADRSFVTGRIADAAAADIDGAVCRASAAQPAWNFMGGTARAGVLRAMADALEVDMDRLIMLLVREAGKTLGDGVAEVREAIDFCRYYAMLATRHFSGPVTLKGPVGENNRLELKGRGVFACISPWNFPLAIFTGQIAAALAAGNAVIAKPAEQTPLIAVEAVRLFYRAGLGADLLALMPGRGETVGAALVGHPGVKGIAFTGGTDTARLINRALAERPGEIIPFIAETGGLNAMFMDTTALPEQVVDDVILSAFGSAGQRCSGLRMLFVPHEVADAVVAMLTGAADALVVGDPLDPATDIGPVIDNEARAQLDAHVERLAREARIVKQGDVGPLRDRGSFFGPLIAEIDRPDFLDREVFGPVLHIHRYDPARLDEVAAAFARPGYGLTLGIHSRLDSFAERIRALVPAGNVYVNRSIIGAVVGVQPFGGIGLSGTGPKAGGPHALLRYANEQAVSVNIMAQGGDPGLLSL